MIYIFLLNIRFIHTDIQGINAMPHVRINGINKHVIYTWVTEKRRILS